MTNLSNDISKLINHEYFISKTNYLVYAPLPNYYLSIPNIPHILPTEYVKFDTDLILDYFESIFNKDCSLWKNTSSSKNHTLS
jgi:hypothetical protein